MAPGRFRVVAAVYGVLIDGDRVLLMRRAGSGYRDGQLSLPAGHLDGGEDALTGLLRELQEELTISADRDSCRLAVLLHRAPESPGDEEYLDLVFTVGCWTGSPAIGEPDKCSELVWADRAHLPAEVVDYIDAALQALDAGEPLLLHGWSQ
jgi:8-oxo-dGTP diphosphatase